MTFSHTEVHVMWILDYENMFQLIVLLEFNASDYTWSLQGRKRWVARVICEGNWAVSCYFTDLSDGFNYLSLFHQTLSSSTFTFLVSFFNISKLAVQWEVEKEDFQGREGLERELIHYRFKKPLLIGAW